MKLIPKLIFLFLALAILSACSSEEPLPVDPQQSADMQFVSESAANGTTIHYVFKGQTVGFTQRADGTTDLTNPEIYTSTHPQFGIVLHKGIFYRCIECSDGNAVPIGLDSQFRRNLSTVYRRYLELKGRTHSPMTYYLHLQIVTTGNVAYIFEPFHRQYI